MPSVSSAEKYFEKRLWTDEWDNSNDTKKEAALTQAENQLDSLNITLPSGDYDRAIYEQAIFLLKLGPEDRKRLSLQSQGVEKINISGGVSESYNGGDNLISPQVKQIIKSRRYQTGEMV
jgi:hypothetical protein